MESYRLKNDSPRQQRRLLLPMSGGVSSLILLQVLDLQLQKQRNSRGRTAYDLHMLMIDTSLQGHDSDMQSQFERVKDNFQSYSWSILPLWNVFESDNGARGALAQLGIEFDESVNPRQNLERTLDSASTPTSRSEISEILLLRLIVAFAKSEHCEAILWGHSDSRLAAKALASVAKGRGSSLPLQICDGPSPWGLNFNYPLRDLFKAELELYAGLQGEAFSRLVIPVSSQAIQTSLRDTSIDDLLANYVTLQGEKYPSIMANVVRTVSKLQRPQMEDGKTACTFCGMPIAAKNVADKTCYACIRTRTDVKPNAHNVSRLI